MKRFRIAASPLWGFALAAVIVSHCLAQASPAQESAKPKLRVENADAVGPRPLEKETSDKVARFYLDAWKSLHTAFAENRPEALDNSFTGIAREKLATAIRDQQALGIKTSYHDQSHDLKFAFYSSEGLSVQVLDTVDYDLQVVDHGQVVGLRHIRSCYVAVLTPTEVRWKVRVFQADSEARPEPSVE